MESLAPFSITGVTGVPGQISCVIRVSGSKTSLIGAGGAMALRSGAVSATTPASETYFTLSCGSAKTANELLANLLGRVAGKDAAVHVGLRGLRQRVVGVSAREPRGHAGGAEVGVEAGFSTETRGGGEIRRIGQNGAHVGRSLARLLLREILEVGARHLIQLERK